MLFSKQKSQLGLDIGTSNIKIAQLQPQDGKFVLETYGLVNVAYQIISKDSDEALKRTAEVLQQLLLKAKVTTKKVVASLPSSSIFTSVIEMPKIPDNELKSAIEFEAKKYVPLPLSEVALSWSVISESKSLTQAKNKIFLTAVPHIVIDNYLKILDMVGLEPQALEIEALALIRSMISDTTKTVIIIDIGAKYTTLNLVENGYLILSKNINIGGDTLTTSISQSLSVNFERAEQFKKDFGLSAPTGQIPQVIKPVLDIIRNETQQLINVYEIRGQRVDGILLSGGGVKLPSIKDYFSMFGKPVVLGQPLNKIIYASNLKPVVEPLGLNLATALGLAMRQT